MCKWKQNTDIRGNLQLNPDNKDFLDYILDKSDSGNKDFYLKEILSPRYFADEIRRRINDINKDLHDI